MNRGNYIIWSILCMSMFIIGGCVDDDKMHCSSEVTDNEFQTALNAERDEDKQLAIVKDYMRALTADSAYVVRIDSVENEGLIIRAEHGIDLCVPYLLILDYFIDKMAATLRIDLSDGGQATLNYHVPLTVLPQSSIVVNPYGPNPLCARWEFVLPRSADIELTVEGKNGSPSDISASFSVSKMVKLPILGLYQDYRNQVDVVIRSKYGQLIYSGRIEIETEALLTQTANIEIVTAQHGEMEAGINMVNSRSHPGLDVPYMFDAFGDIRWILDYKDDVILNRLFYDTGIERLKNGNWYFGDIRQNKIYELGLLGNIVQSWSLGGYQFHHKVQEKSDGNFLVSVSDPYSTHDNGRPTVEDFIIEIDRQAGDVIQVWDLKESLDEYRTAFANNLMNARVDWIHVNALVYDESDNTIIISGRTQGVAKLTYSNELVWILAPHAGWSENRRGEDLNNFLLQPLDNDGIPIMVNDILLGHENHLDFEWNWAQHSVSITPSGRLLLFDNGDKRNLNQGDTYSRVVEYEIDASAKTVQQTWSFGKSLGTVGHSRIASYANYFPDSDNYLSCPGFNVPTNSGIGGKIYEIDRLTKDVIFEAHISTTSTFAFHRAQRYTLYPE